MARARVQRARAIQHEPGGAEEASTTAIAIEKVCMSADDAVSAGCKRRDAETGCGCSCDYRRKAARVGSRA